MANHPVVSRDEWLRARIDFLGKEKEFTRLRDELSRQRRALPWVRVEKTYVFDGPAGKESGQSKPSIFVVQIRDGKVALPDFLAKK